MTSIEDIFRLKIQPDRDDIRLRFKKEKYRQPVFRDLEETTDGTIVSLEKALPYKKCRDPYVRLGRVAGFEHILEFYQLRRASGRKINSKIIFSITFFLIPAYFLLCTYTNNWESARCSDSRRAKPGHES